MRERSRRRVVATRVGLSGLTAVTLLLGLVLVTGGLFVPAHYVAPWSRDYHREFTDPRVQLVAHGLLAPSGHNMQPWIVRLDPTDRDVLYLYADASRLTPVVDPLARQTMVSQGTFLEYVEVAAGKLGHDITTTLFPDGPYDEQRLAASMRSLPVARITMRPADPVSNPLYAGLFRSDTNRAVYRDATLSTAETAKLAGIRTVPRTTMTVLTGGHDLATLGALSIQGTTVESRLAAASRETDHVFRFNEYSKNQHPWGFSVEGQGTTGFMKYLTQGAITLLPAINSDASGATRSIRMTTAGAAHTPAYGLIQTAGNSRVDQVRAGMLYSRLSLTARSMGLVMQPVSQVLQEYPEMRAARAAVQKEFARSGATIQLLVRIGRPTVDYPPTMRRDVMDLVQ